MAEALQEFISKHTEQDQVDIHFLLPMEIQGRANSREQFMQLKQDLGGNTSVESPSIPLQHIPVLEQFYYDNKKLSTRRASWGTLFSILGSMGSYTAYVFIIIKAISGQLSIGDLTFLAGSFQFSDLHTSEPTGSRLQCPRWQLRYRRSSPSLQP